MLYELKYLLMRKCGSGNSDGSKRDMNIRAQSEVLSEGTEIGLGVSEECGPLELRGISNFLHPLFRTLYKANKKQ